MRGQAVRLVGAGGFGGVLVEVALAGKVFPGRGSVVAFLWAHLGIYFVMIA